MQINVLEYFDKSLKEDPDRIAVIDGDRQLTFTQLSIIATADTMFKANITAKEVIESETIGGLKKLIEKKRK